VGVLVVNDSCRKYSDPGAGLAGRWIGMVTVLPVIGAMSSWPTVSVPCWTGLPSATSVQWPSYALTFVNRFSFLIVTVPDATSAPATTLMAW
jgi:hypothetical protein